MTEKRFAFNLTLGEDEHKGLIFDNGQVMTTIEVAHMLNKQKERIQELEQENKQLKEEIEKYKQSNREAIKIVERYNRLLKELGYDK